MLNVFRLIALVVTALTIIATSQPPEVSFKQRYILDFDPVTRVYSKTVVDERCTGDIEGLLNNPDFTYDSSEDRVNLKITDILGLDPGQSFQHQFQLKKIGIGSPAHQTFVLDLQNPFNSSQKKHVFEFEFKPNAGKPNSIRKGTMLEGVYELLGSNRELYVELSFDLSTNKLGRETCKYEIDN